MHGHIGLRQGGNFIIKHRSLKMIEKKYLI